MRNRLPGIMCCLLAASAVTVVAARTAAPAIVVVRVDSGALAGAERDGVLIFQGVPYAAPPLGDLRWRTPQHPQPWQGERAATSPGPICMQRPHGRTGPAVSEDCLTLQVFAPKGAHGAPVLVWLHGGSNVIGSSSSPLYDGTAFARDGVVLVAANYRLGAFGFFSHPALSRAAAAGEAVANFGLLDQVAALKWVAKNVAAFGGDPKRVTLAGESAGATDALALMASPAARGLFAQAVIESPGWGWVPLPSLRDAERRGERTAATAGAPAGATAAMLRAIPAERLVAADPGDCLTVLDGSLLPESPMSAFAGGRAAHFPLVIGSNSHEASLIEEDGGDPATVQGFDAATRAAYAGDAITPQALGAALFTDRYFTAPERWTARLASRAAPAWLYYFSYVRVSQRSKVPGAGHGSELPYVFDSWDKISPRAAWLPAEDRAMTATVHTLWVSFITAGRPAAPGLPPWPVYDADRDELLELGIRPAVRQHFRQRQLDAQEHAAAALLPMPSDPVPSGSAPR